MLVNPSLGAVTSALSGKTADRINKSVEQISSGNRITSAATDVSSLSVATSLQNQVTGLRSALSNTSQFTSLAQTADAGIDQIQQLLGRAKELATQANSGALNDNNRAALDDALQEVLNEIDRIAENTQFNDVKPLNGSLSGEGAITLNSALGEPESENAGEDDGSSLDVESLSTANRLGAISLATQEDAQAAITAIQQAQNSVGTTRASVGAFSQQVDFASAFLETAIANQSAAASTLADADFAAAATELSQALTAQEAETLVNAQVRHLAPAMIRLIT